MQRFREGQLEVQRVVVEESITERKSRSRVFKKRVCSK
jgi:hypothetical protein